MSVKKITYNDKEYIRNDPNYSREQTITDDDMNEIKEVVNTNANEQDIFKEKLKNALITEETEEAKSIHVTDTSGLGILEVLGNHEQETREGKNLYNLNDVSDKSSGVVVDEDDWIEISFDETKQDITYMNYMLKPSNKLKTNSTYYLILEIKELSGSGNLNVSQYLDSSKSQIETSISRAFSDLSVGTRKYTVTTIEDFTDVSYMIRTFASFNVGQTGKIVFRLSLLEQDVDTSNFEYEKYGATPSPEYPSPVICLGSNTDGSFKGSTEIKMKNADETQEKSYTLPIQQEMLKGDYFIKESDGWKEVHGIIKIVIDGVNTKVRNLKLIANNTMIQFAVDSEKALNKNGIAVSNCFKQSKNWSVINTVVISDLGTLYFHCKSDVISEITNDAMNALLQQMYEQGNPLICYATATNSEKLTCTKEQSAVLEELNNLDLYKPVTNIITTEDIALLKLKYSLDVKSYVDNKISSLTTQTTETTQEETI